MVESNTATPVVKLAGHSCPTAASAYLMTAKALAALYGDELPERGGIRVACHDDAEAGVTGVIANVACMITGATQTTGFKGIGGRFDRRHLLDFNVPMAGEFRFSRVESGRSAVISASLAKLPAAPQMRELMGMSLSGGATEAQAREFGRLWQDRVEALLIDLWDDPDVINCRVAARLE